MGEDYQGRWKYFQVCVIITICELATLLRIINLTLRLRVAYLFLSDHAGKCMSI